MAVWLVLPPMSFSLLLRSFAIRSKPAAKTLVREPWTRAMSV